jgi:predicted hydrolase (HD superfamily)
MSRGFSLLMPLLDRIAALIASIVTRKDAAKAVVHIIAITTVMARHLGEAERIAIAEILHDAA